ncbi:MAG: hypothetical protein ABEK02_06360 [Haloquadratum sp.]
MRRTRAVGTLFVVLFLAAGCLGGPPSAGTDTATATPTQTPTATAAPGSPTPTPDPTPGETPTETWEPTTRASEIPDADKAVHVENRWNRSVEVRIRVVRVATNETVYAGTETFDPGADRDVYSIAEADPDGIESFRVVATALNTTESVTIETNACYGNVYVEITEDGTLYLYYAIC